MKNNVNGIFILDKPLGISSNAALQKVKRLFNAKKAGHTGSLDPLASGVLPICFGEATKFSQFLLDADKRYAVSMQLGVRTTTSDAEGEIVAEKNVPQALTLEKIDRLFDTFRGEIQQVPSMFSALKHNGTPLYVFARQGLTVDRPSRPITIFNLQVLSLNDNQVDFTVHCSKGTYVRTLVDDFGELLGCGAHVCALRRLSVGPFDQSQMHTIDALMERESSNQLNEWLLPVDLCVQHWPELRVSEAIARRLQQGQKVVLPELQAPGMIRLVLDDNQFIGVGEIVDSRVIVPRRLVI